MILEYLRKMMRIVTQSIHQNVRQEGRYFRHQLFDLGLSLLLISGAVILLVAGILAAAWTAYTALRLVTGHLGALAIMSFFILAVAITLGYVGYRMQSKQDDKPLQESSDPSRSDEFAPGRTMQSKSRRALQSRPDQDSETMDTVHEQLDQKLEIVRRYPITSVAVAMGLGVLIGRSKSARHVAKHAAIMGGKVLVDRYLNDRH